LTQRLGIYVDDVFVVDERGGHRRISVDRAFLLFASEVGRHFAGRAVFGRTLHRAPPSDYELPPDVELIELPHYSSLFRLTEVLRAAPGTISAFWRGVDGLDVVWAFGPHPFAIPLVLVGALKRKRVVLGVRQDTLGYYRHRLPSRAWTPVLGAIWVFDVTYRLLARRLPTTVVGTAVAAHYGGERATRLTMTATLMRPASVVESPPDRDWSGPIHLLTVGRLDTEKNPMLLLDAMRRLEDERPGRYRLVWVGRGPLEREVRDRIAELGLDGVVELRGYVPFGEQLLALYRDAHMFVHVSRTEGLPQVIIEANASGIPVVATNVGGVAAALEDGNAGLLVPPEDLGALVEGVTCVTDDGALRERLVARGLELARERTLDVEAARVAAFVAGG
jgi:glycosyltransferase involved in cell wall biosynthesis